MPHKIMLLLLGLAIGWTLFIGCGSTSATRDEMAVYAEKLFHCQEIGRDAGSYAAYENCTTEAGLR